MWGKLKETIPSKVKIGFGAAFTSWVFDTLLEVLQMKGIALSPTSLDVAFYGLIVLLGFGLLMMVWGFVEWARKTRQQKQIIENQSDDIAGLENSLELFRRGFHSPYNTYLVVLPHKLTQIHQYLQSAAEQVVETKLNDILLYNILQSWATKIKVRIWYKPKHAKINKFLWNLQILTLLADCKKALTLLDDKMLTSLHKLAGELDDKGIGLLSRLDNSYTQTRTELDDILKSLGSPTTNNYIEKYLLYSYSLNSLLLFITYISPAEYQKWLPMKYRTPQASLIQAINAQMRNQRAEVVKHIHLYLVGKE